MKVLDLFSGIGGFSLGLERAGMQTIAFCEIDPFCRKVLRKHWPDVPIHEDIRELDGEQYRGTTELVCGGFPCQPFSVAGKQAGSGDDRHLWPEMLRVIREVQPRFVVGENVLGIIGMELDAVLSDLEGLGYACGTFVIPACAVDAPHRRDRVWVVAHANGGGESVVTKHGNSRCGELGSVADTHEQRSNHDDPRCNVEREQPPHRQQSGSGWTSSYRGHSRWLPEPSLDRVADGVPDRAHRIRALGNAVVPQIPEIIGRAIMEARPCN